MAGMGVGVGGRGADSKRTCWGDENVLCLDGGVHLSNHIELYTFNRWISLCVNYTSKKLSFNQLVLK